GRQPVEIVAAVAVGESVGLYGGTGAGAYFHARQGTAARIDHAPANARGTVGWRGSVARRRLGQTRHRQNQEGQETEAGSRHEDLESIRRPTKARGHSLSLARRR